MKWLAALLFLSAGVSAAQDATQDAKTILARARAAYIANHLRERFWTWTTVFNRVIVNKASEVLQTFPSVTVESPIRSDGRRCTAVLAWGDGVEPYLAGAGPDERCAVMEETPSTFNMEEFLSSRRVKIDSRTASAIKLSIHEDKNVGEAENIVKRCVASARGTLEVDPVSFFPIDIEVQIPGDACLVKGATAQNHYDDAPTMRVNSGFTKGTLLRFHCELQRDKAGDRSKDFWIATRSSSDRPFVKGAGAVLISGRRFVVQQASDRVMRLEATTTTTELSAESSITFEKEK